MGDRLRVAHDEIEEEIGNADDYTAPNPLDVIVLSQALFKKPSRFAPRKVAKLKGPPVGPNVFTKEMFCGQAG